jgi:hypothetical protein
MAGAGLVSPGWGGCWGGWRGGLIKPLPQTQIDFAYPAGQGQDADAGADHQGHLVFGHGALLQRLPSLLPITSRLQVAARGRTQAKGPA